MSYNKQSQQTKPVKASQLLSNLSQMSEMMQEILDRQKGFHHHLRLSLHRCHHHHSHHHLKIILVLFQP